MTLYFSFTTLTTVGFGDIVPHSDSERFFCSLFLLFGVALFSYIQNIFRKTIENLSSYNKDFEQDMLLLYFVNVFKRFNKGLPIKKSVSQKIIDFMHFSWQNNGNLCLREQS